MNDLSYKAIIIITYGILLFNHLGSGAGHYRISAFIAAVRKITQFSLSDSSVNFVFISILGAAVAAVIGYLTIKRLLKYLADHSLVVFAVYRFILAIVLLIFFIL